MTNMNNKERKILYKCSNPSCSFEEFMKVDAVILSKDGPNNMKKVGMGDTCFICNEGTLVGDRFDQEFDPIEYPTLIKYTPRQIWNTVISLQSKYPNMTDEQCLLNLEMDLAEQEQLATGK